MKTAALLDAQIAPLPFPAAAPAIGPAAQAPDRITLFGLNLVNASAETALDAIFAAPRARVAFVNAHCVNMAACDAAYRDALLDADFLLPDGAGVEGAARLTGQRFAANLNGTDLYPKLRREAARRGLSIFFFGAAPGVAAEAARRAAVLYPGLRVAGSRDGFADAENDAAAIGAINASGADIVLVAMGVPKQDLWLARHADRLSARFTFGVGALFDFAADRVRRAPAPIRAARLEWAWRLALEPKRLAARYLIGNPLFVARSFLHAVVGDAGAGLGKRALDVAVSSAALVVAAPVMLLVAAAIRLESPGPALFRQTRIGRDGTPFTILKFRSMRSDAETRRAALLAHSDRDGICFKSRSDPRVTRVGRLIRRFSIDELPQLFTVLGGAMSVVGPRPALPEEVAQYVPAARRRLAAKPGITGLWQVSGRAEVDFDRMARMDAAYAGVSSIVVDILMMGLTARAVLGGRGAC